MADELKNTNTSDDNQADISYETADLDDSVVAEENAIETVKKLRAKLKEAEKKSQEYLDGWQRMKADFLNAKKRDEETQKEFRKYATEGFIEELLPVLQSFDMAFANKEAWEKVDKNWRNGVEYIHGQLKSVLDSHGLKEVDPQGKPFDPARDEAMEYVPVTDEKLHHMVISVVQKGYELNGKQMRPPRVKVGEYKAG